jgi:hypothetical protein
VAHTLRLVAVHVEVDVAAKQSHERFQVEVVGTRRRGALGRGQAVPLLLRLLHLLLVRPDAACAYRSVT